MDGPLYLQGPFRPIPLYCPRPPLLEGLSRAYPVPAIAEAGRTALKLGTNAENLGKVSTSALTTFPYSLSLFDHVRRQQTNCFRVFDALPKIHFGPTLSQPTIVLSERQASSVQQSRDIFSLRPPPTAAQNEKVVSAEALPGSVVGQISDPYSSQYGYGRKIFPCSQCRYTTDRRNNLKRHMLTMHQACSKLLECCGILFATKASLREHAMIFHYHGYTCFYCGRRFCRKALLKRHLSVHNGQKDFVCTICDYATSHKSNLERHRKVHSRQEDGRDRESTSATPGDDTRDHSGDENITLDVSSDELSLCSEDDEEINVHTD
ncbi:zinc finger protein 534-like [Gigantopelta aegis]|uniref:zinc finger protein 534-like n=1 Tax=Gigantopelta aegis TaxID=1735272 RepID=UPI001B887DB8|nr:zinc finger protein 534-like [Gigantopelta aegis]